MENDKEPKNRIKEVLEASGKSQVWLSKKINTSKNAINALCSNSSQPSLNRLFEIAKALNVPAYTLIADYDPDKLRAELWEEIKDKVEDDKTNQQ